MKQAEDRPSEKGRELATFAYNAQGQKRPAAIHWEPLEFQDEPTRRPLWTILLGVVGLLLTGLIAYLAIAQKPTPRSGMIESIQQGSLQISRGQDESWQSAEEGGTIHQGSSIRSMTDTWATIALPDQSLMRIEAPGMWEVMELVGKGNHLRITIKQKAGRASFISPPPRKINPSRFQIQVANISADLVGVGTFITDSDGRSRIHILQGHCTLGPMDSPTRIVSGQTAIIDPDNGSIAVTESE
ncbi:MAG: hypothetical protein ACLFV5_08130 [Anaerolineales bacterium]